jgi:cyanophycin synthetase
MVSITQNFKSLPGYLFGVNQPITLGQISFDLDDKEEIDAISRIRSYEGLTFDGAQDHKNIAEYFCKTFVFIQQSSGIPISNNYFFYLEKNIENKLYNVILPTLNTLANKITLGFLIHFINLINKKNYALQTKNEIDQRFVELRKKLDQIGATGQNYFNLINAALDQDINILSSNPRLLRFGIGKSQIFMNSTITQYTPFIGTQLAQDKFITSQILNQSGMPGTQCFRIKNVEQAIFIANKINYPVVVKPANLDRGIGVYANLINDAMVKEFFHKATLVSKNIVIEKHYEGFGHRLTFFNGRVIKVTKKFPAGIHGDGKKNIKELIEETNAKNIDLSLNRNLHQSNMELDEEAMGLLHQFNLTPESIVEEGKFFPLKRRNNTIAGGSNEIIEVKDVHPDNIDLCIRAAQLFCLDIAGIDLIIDDIRKSWLEQNCAICEMNAMPQTDKLTIKTILSELMADADAIELHLGITTENSLELLDEEIKNLSLKLGCNGYTSSRGLIVDDKIISRAFASHFFGTLALARCKNLKKGLAVIPITEIKKVGLPLNKFSSIRMINKLEEKDIEERDFQVFLDSIKQHTSQLII